MAEVLILFGCVLFTEWAVILAINILMAHDIDFGNFL